MKKVGYVVMGGPNCAWCKSAKTLLEKHGFPYTYYDVTKDKEAQEEFISSGFKSVPQIFYSEKHIGGFNQLQEFLDND